jgi:hypothetical protein
LQRVYFKKVIAAPQSELYRHLMSALGAPARLPSFGAHFSLALMLLRLLRISKVSSATVRAAFEKDLQQAVRPVSRRRAGVADGSVSVGRRQHAACALPHASTSTYGFGFCCAMRRGVVLQTVRVTCCSADRS